MQLHNLGVMRALSAAFAALALLLIAGAAHTWTQLDAVANANANAAKRLVPQMARVAAIELNITRASLLARHAMLARTPEELRATLAEVGDKRKLIDEAANGIEANLHSARSKELFAALKQRMAEFWKVGETNLTLTSAGKKAEAFDHLVTTLVPARNAFLLATNDLSKYQ